MNLETEVRAVMNESGKALTVDQVAEEVSVRMKGEIRSILNALVEKQELTSVHGGGGYSTHYRTAPIKRRI